MRPDRLLRNYMDEAAVFKANCPSKKMSSQQKSLSLRQGLYRFAYSRKVFSPSHVTMLRQECSSHETILPSVHDKTIMPSVHNKTILTSVHHKTIMPSVHNKTIMPSVHNKTILTSLHNKTACPIPLSILHIIF